METRKRIGLGLVIAILIITALLIGTFALGNTSAGLSLEEAERIGYEAGAAYREHIDELIREIQTQIINNNTEGFEQTIRDLEWALTQQTQQTGQLTASLVLTLRNTREGLVVLRNRYQDELLRIALYKQALRSSMAGTVGMEYAGFEFAYRILDAQNEATHATIFNLNMQITELGILINQAEQGS